ncbi:MAG: cell division protein SepF [Clostridia bacterium]|jgi:cell division inhibitor SepF|nr:cell division protein SepF [Clostridiales bacterium]
MENGLWNKILRFLGLVDPEPEESTPEIEDTYPVPRKKGKVLDIRTASQVKMVIYQPVTFDQTEEICDNLKNRKPVIVNLEKLENEVAQRILDFLSGAVYGLDGNLHKVSGGIFIAAPSNVEISEHLKDELKDKMIFKWQK